MQRELNENRSSENRSSQGAPVICAHSQKRKRSSIFSVPNPQKRETRRKVFSVHLSLINVRVPHGVHQDTMCGMILRVESRKTQAYFQERRLCLMRNLCVLRSENPECGDARGYLEASFPLRALNYIHHAIEPHSSQLLQALQPYLASPRRVYRCF